MIPPVSGSQPSGSVLTAAQAASALGMSVEEIRTLCRTGQLPGAQRQHRRGAWQIPLAAVQELAASRPNASPPGGSVGASHRPQDADRSQATSGPSGRWLRFSNNPLVFYTRLIISGIALFVALFGIVSVLADWDGFIQKLVGWNIVRDIQPAAPGETLIIIARFHHPPDVPDRDIHTEIRRAIQKALAEEHFANLRVEVLRTRLEADDRVGAQSLLKHHGASTVIWGSDSGVRTAVSFWNAATQDFEGIEASIDETERSQLVNPTGYAQYVTEDLPNHLTFLSLLAIGRSYSSQERYDESIRALEKGIAISPPSRITSGEAAEMYFRLGWARQHFLGDFQGAARDYTEAMRLSPDRIDALVNRAVARRAMGDLEGALADYNSALTCKPNDTIALYNRGNARSAQGDWAGALADYDRLILLAPMDVKGYLARGQLAAQMNRPFDAITDYERAMALDPGNSTAYFRRGVVRLKLGNLSSATEDFKAVLRLAPNTAEAYGNLGFIYIKRDNYNEAIICFDDALRINPRLANAYSGRGVARQALGYRDSAMSDYGQALQIDPGNAEALNNRAILLREQSDFAGALTDLDRAIELKPDFPGSYSNRGMTRFIMGDMQGALADYRHYLKLFPTAPDRSAVERLIADVEARRLP